MFGPSRDQVDGVAEYWSYNFEAFGGSLFGTGKIYD
jgi:hypothetical protein